MTKFVGIARTEVENIKKDGKVPMVSLDMRKCEKFVTEFGESNTFFVFPPSIADLKIRMKTNDVANEIKKDEL